MLLHSSCMFGQRIRLINLEWPHELMLLFSWCLLACHSIHQQDSSIIYAHAHVLQVCFPAISANVWLNTAHCALGPEVRGASGGVSHGIPTMQSARVLCVAGIIRLLARDGRKR